MNADLLEFLCDPVDKSPLRLFDAVFDAKGRVVSGVLRSESGREFPVRDYIPRFVRDASREAAVASFGDEWNYFNFDQFRLNWLNHTVRNTFGSTDVFRGKVVVDAGAGSGMQSSWMSEAGAARVISLELSHSVDGVMRKNLTATDNVDIVQCSIDLPPIKDRVITGMVICHNVIQFTPSVENTARALWRLLAPGGELVFNCYLKYDGSRLWMLRFRWYSILRGYLVKRSFRFRLSYAKAMAVLRFVPLLGWFLEEALFVVCGDVPPGPAGLQRKYRAAVLNTFDWYGAHRFQHHKTEAELRALVSELQPDAAKVQNLEGYFSRPLPIGRALRLEKAD